MQDGASYKTKKQSAKRERTLLELFTLYFTLHFTLDLDLKRENRGTHRHIYKSRIILLHIRAKNIDTGKARSDVTNLPDCPEQAGMETAFHPSFYPGLAYALTEWNLVLLGMESLALVQLP